MVGREHQLPHSLVPLSLAVLLVRAKLPGEAGADPDAVATFIASAVPVFEYWDTPLRFPQPLANTLREGVFRDAGRELHFLDGRPTKYRLAVQAADVDCVIEMLMHPERAAHTRNRVLRAHARELVRTSRDLSTQAAALRGTAEKLLARASLVSQPVYPSRTSSP